jgi:hypothetical protein
VLLKGFAIYPIQTVHTKWKLSWLIFNSNVGALAECFNWFMAGQRDGWMLTKPYFQPPVLLYPRKWFRCNKAKERRDAGQMLMRRVYLYSNVRPRVRFLVYVALVHARRTCYVVTGFCSASHPNTQLLRNKSYFWQYLRRTLSIKMHAKF